MKRQPWRYGFYAHELRCMENIIKGITDEFRKLILEKDAEIDRLKTAVQEKDAMISKLSLKITEWRPLLARSADALEGEPVYDAVLNLLLIQELRDAVK
jgi:hypothetical protein